MIEANRTINSNPAEARISRSFKTRMVYPSTFSPKLFTLFILLRMKTEMIFHFQIIYKLISSSRFQQHIFRLHCPSEVLFHYPYGNECRHRTASRHNPEQDDEI